MIKLSDILRTIKSDNKINISLENTLIAIKQLLKCAFTFLFQFLSRIQSTFYYFLFYLFFLLLILPKLICIKYIIIMYFLILNKWDNALHPRILPNNTAKEFIGITLMKITLHIRPNLLNRYDKIEI